MLSLSLFRWLVASAQLVKLEIPQIHISDSGEISHTTYRSKNYYFVTDFKVSSLGDRSGITRYCDGSSKISRKLLGDNSMCELFKSRI